MKAIQYLLATVAAVALFVAGCSSSATKVDTEPLTKAFAGADTALKTAAEAAITKVKSGDYKGALEELQKLAKDVKLNDEQKKALTDVVGQVQKAVSEAATKAAGEAGKALDNVNKSLPK